MSRFEHSIDVNVPLGTVYNQWTQFAEFPHFMEGVKSVRQITDTTLHWVAEIAGRTQEWDAEITEQKPDSRISWNSTSGAKHDGLVTFHYISQDTTRVMLQINYEPDGLIENVGAALGIVQRRITGDLERFKAFIEDRGYETGAWRGEVDRYGEPVSFGNRYNETVLDDTPPSEAITPVRTPAVAFDTSETADTPAYHTEATRNGGYVGAPSFTSADVEVDSGHTEERGERNVLGDDSFSSAENTATVKHEASGTGNWYTDGTASPADMPVHDDLGNSDVAPGGDPAHSLGAVEDEPQNHWDEEDQLYPFANEEKPR